TVGEVGAPAVVLEADEPAEGRVDHHVADEPSLVGDGLEVEQPDAGELAVGPGHEAVAEQLVGPADRQEDHAGVARLEQPVPAVLEIAGDDVLAGVLTATAEDD